MNIVYGVGVNTIYKISKYQELIDSIDQIPDINNGKIEYKSKELQK